MCFFFSQARFPSEYSDFLAQLQDSGKKDEQAENDVEKQDEEMETGQDESTAADVNMDETGAAQVAPAAESNEDANAVEADAVAQPNDAELKGIRNLMRYYADGVKFCTLVKTTVPIMCEILASNKKLEIVEAMNYFVILHMYGMDCALVNKNTMVTARDIFFRLLTITPIISPASRRWCTRSGTRRLRASRKSLENLKLILKQPLLEAFVIT